MALRGTLVDFGLANVFQIIGRTSKTGTLAIKDRDEEVKLHFSGGSIVRCDASRRRRSELLGAMLRRAEVITEAHLAAALEVQKTTHRRLGDCLITAGVLTPADLADFARLQTTETVYRVFLWREGTYEFTATTPPVPNHSPLRAESLLMAGFIQIDEWPAIKKRLSSYAATFSIRHNLDMLLAGAAAEEVDSTGIFAAPSSPARAGASAAPSESFEDFGLDEAGAGSATPAQDGPLAHIEHKERLIYSLIQPERDVQRLIDISRLGEFETCRALVHLLDARLIALHPPRVAEASAAATVGGMQAPSLRRRLAAALSARRLGQVRYIVAAAVGLVVILASGLSPWEDLSADAPRFYPRALERALQRGELRRLNRALTVYLTIHGEYPASLQDLKEVGVPHATVTPRLWRADFVYARRAGGYVLVAPLQ